MTARQQRSPTELSRHAFSLYRQCVAAGQWARINIENRPDGQHITLSSRPMAAAPAAACAQEGAARRRRPNQRRKEKKELWLRSRQQQQLQAASVAAARPGSYAQAAAKETSTRGQEAPSLATAAHIGSLVSSPRLTRAAKRRKENTPGEMAVPAFAQLDGADASPPSSPPEPLTPESFPMLAARKEPLAATIVQTRRLLGHPTETEELQPATSVSPGRVDHQLIKPPPPPPPWSRYLPSYWEQVICHLCLQEAHGYRRFNSYEACARR